jgi:hypothetical protein
MQIIYMYKGFLTDFRLSDRVTASYLANPATSHELPLKNQLGLHNPVVHFSGIKTGKYYNEP